MQPFADAFPAENIAHHFQGGVYAKEIHIPMGYEIVSHEHPYAHLSILASGTALIRCGDGLPLEATGPSVITITAGLKHSVYAITDAVWFCIHPTDETDPAKVDAVILSEGKT